jgi:ribonuclease Z
VDLSIFFAGTAGSVPSARRGLPALLVSRGGERLLFDCGEGTQRQLLRSVGLANLDAVFITHFHADHWLGLPGMLKSFALASDRTAPLSVYGPKGLRELMSAMRIVYGRLPYELDLRELEPMESVRGEGYEVVALETEHGTRGSLGYALVEHERPGQFDPAAAQALGIVDVRDYGRLQRGENVAGVEPGQVMGPPRQGRKIVYSGDSSPCDALALAAHEADVLVHEATFAQDELARARETGHSTAAQAAALARGARVRLLALTHISGRYLGGELSDEARAEFAETVVARDFDTIEVPFPERGAPRLVRWSERRAAERAGSNATSVAEEREAEVSAQEAVAPS